MKNGNLNHRDTEATEIVGRRSSPPPLRSLCLCGLLLAVSCSTRAVVARRAAYHKEAVRFEAMVATQTVSVTLPDCTGLMAVSYGADFQITGVFIYPVQSGASLASAEIQYTLPWTGAWTIVAWRADDLAPLYSEVYSNAYNSTNSVVGPFYDAFYPICSTVVTGPTFGIDELCCLTNTTGFYKLEAFQPAIDSPPGYGVAHGGRFRYRCR
jgi:hypothetical protein